MFFGNKKNDSLIESLTNEILELKKKLEEKDNELKNFINSSSLKLDDIVKNKDKEIELYKTISSFSQEEGLVVLDENDKLFFVNDLSKSHIEDFSPIINAVKSNEDKVILEECEAKISVKKLLKSTSKTFVSRYFLICEVFKANISITS